MQMAAGDFVDLPLFSGMHVQAVRFESALDRFDFRAAAEAAPEGWSDAPTHLADVIERAGGIDRVSVEDLAICRQSTWPAALERAWQRLVGRRLEASPDTATYEGEMAAAYLLRGGDIDRARRSLERHLGSHPRDSRAWQLMTTFEPRRAAVRCAFHGGPVLDTLNDLVDLIEEDGLEPLEPWLLSYAWLNRDISLDEIRAALAVDAGMNIGPPEWEAARNFARRLLDAGGQRAEPHSASPSVITARQQLKSISEAAFRRYLARA